MRSALLAATLVLIAPVIQVALVNGLSLPGGGPDVVLIGVVALALALRPTGGTFLGFAAGLAVDVAPPADHSIGRYALVMCLVGWSCGRVPADSTAGFRITVAALATLGGTLLDPVLAFIVGDETWTSVVGGLPGSLAWTVAGAVLVVGTLSLLPRRRRPLGRAPSAGLRSPYARSYHA